VPDILCFFERFNAVEDSVKIMLDAQGRPSGMATVCFSSEVEAKRAMEEMQGRNIGHRYIELTTISFQDS
jgi:RNA recognition motif-containing protein